MENGKQPINPTMYTRVSDDKNGYAPLKDGQKTGYEVKFGGLTKREYFAAKAMQAYTGGEYTRQSGMPHEMIAEWSVKMADALLEALEKKYCR